MVEYRPAGLMHDVVWVGGSFKPKKRIFADLESSESTERAAERGNQPRMDAGNRLHVHVHVLHVYLSNY